jgi:hypothetical protein
MYSLGVVLLEIAGGKRPTSSGQKALLALVLVMYHDQSRILDAADRWLNGQFDQHQMERVLLTALWCAHQDTMQRPSIAEAMDFLQSANAKLPVVPARREKHILAPGLRTTRLQDKNQQCIYMIQNNHILVKQCKTIKF